MSQFQTILYRAEPPVAAITLNRPDQLNTIVPPMPDEIEAAIGLAERDPAVKVIVLRGAGRAFSGGYDFGGGFEHWDEGMNTDGRWDPGKDFAMVSARETGPSRRGQRLCVVCRSGDRQRRRGDRNAVCAHVGYLLDRHVAVPAEPCEGEVAFADR